MKNSRLRKIIIGSVGLIVLCCVGFVIIGLLLPDPEPGEATVVAEVAEEEAVEEVEETAVIATDTAEPTNTAAPIDTPAPTETAVSTSTLEATNTPAATDTPTATATPDPGELTAEEQLYIESVTGISGAYSQALLSLSEQMLAAGENPSLMFNEDWIIQVAAATVLLSFTGEEVRELEPSERFETLNDHLLEAAEHFDMVAELLPEAIDELNVEKMNQVSEEMLAGQEAINEANAEILRLIEEEGIHLPGQ